MSTLEELISKIDRTAFDATRVLDEIHPAMRGGWSARIAEAQGELKKLRTEYRAAVLANGVAIFLSGDAGKISEFAKLVHDEGEALVVDATALYRRLAAAVDVTMDEKARQWGVMQTQKLHIALQEVMHELGLSSIPAPVHDEAPILKTVDDVVAHVRKIMRVACGDTLNAAYVADQAAVDALKIRYMGVLVPVAVLNAGEDEAATLASMFAKGSASTVLTVEDKVSKDFMNKTFTEINKKIRKQQKK